MKYTELLSIPLRVLGVYILYSAALAVVRQYYVLGQVAGSADAADYNFYAVLAVLEVGVMLVAAFVLIKLPLTLSKLLTPTRHEGAFNSSITAEQLQSVALCVLGIYILSQSIPDFVANAAWLLKERSQLHRELGNYHELVINEVVTVVEVFIGMALCIKSDGIGRLIQRLRTGRTPSL